MRIPKPAKNAKVSISILFPGEDGFDDGINIADRFNYLAGFDFLKIAGNADFFQVGQDLILEENRVAACGTDRFKVATAGDGMGGANMVRGIGGQVTAGIDFQDMVAHAGILGGF